MEAPTAAHLARIAPGKKFDSEILAPMRQGQSAPSPKAALPAPDRPPSLVVGAAGEADREVARAAAWAYGEMGLARVYYSAMQPVPGTPVADRPRWPLAANTACTRWISCCEATVFSVDEIEFDSAGALPLDVDPKTPGRAVTRSGFRSRSHRRPGRVAAAFRASGLAQPSAWNRCAAHTAYATSQPCAQPALLGRCFALVLLDGKPAERQMNLWQ